MHIADALLSSHIAVPMCIVSGAVLALSAARAVKDGSAEARLPLMAAGGAFIFAAQMINFAIPGTGASGHITGGVLLAAMLGGNLSVICIAAVLAIQALFFADGGILALGCNIFNMGILPCLVVYPLFFKPFTKNAAASGRIFAAALLSCILALQAGAFAAVLEITLSGAAAIPFRTFALLMQPIHLAIGIAEGVITGAVLRFVYRSRPEILDCLTPDTQKPTSSRGVALIFSAAAVAALLLSVFASRCPDGLEWSLEKISELGSL
ncbi:MAG: energy-coupling factor ABC transporter permease [Synergistes sp.]|nr:energy-coupling factor ABC transporter permease [Synergistes sp.]